jgi:hypothetical protein
MTQVLGDYSGGILGDYNAQAVSQSNQWLPNGDSYITADNLLDMTGDITEIVFRDLLIDLNDPVIVVPLFSQGTRPGMLATRDIAVSIVQGGFVTVYYKGEDALLALLPGDILAQWPDNVITGELRVVFNESLGSWAIFADTKELRSGSLTINHAYVPSGSTVFIGAQPSTNDIGETDAFDNQSYKAQIGWRFGDIEVLVDGAPVMRLEMPTGTTTNIPDTVGNNDGTLREGTGDGSDWGQPLAAENTISVSTTEAGQMLGGLMPGNNVSSPSTNELAVMSTALISGLNSTSFSRSEFGSMVSQKIFGLNEASGSSAQLGTMTTDGFISGLVVKSGSKTQTGQLVTAIISASDSLSASTTVQGVMKTALISGLSSISASNTEFGILTTIKYKSNRIMVIGA